MSGKEKIINSFKTTPAGRIYTGDLKYGSKDFWKETGKTALTDAILSATVTVITGGIVAFLKK